MGFLIGYKTYIIGGLTILGTIGGWLGGTIEPNAAIQLIITALLGMTIRSGVSSVGKQLSTGEKVTG